MWTFLSLSLAALVVALFAHRYRRAYLRELPLRLWGRDFPDCQSVALELERATGLARQQLPAGLAWLGDFCLSPVWLFWGDLRTSRPERRLSRWRLEGSLASGRRASMQLGPDETGFSVSCSARLALWAEAAAPLETQEGLRQLHPIGSPRWLAATAHLRALFAGQVSSLRLEHERLRCSTPLDARAPEPTACAALLEELEALAATLEA